MQNHEENLASRVNGSLQPLLGVMVTVKTPTGLLATIYGDDGVTVQPNPMVTNANGLYGFRAANGPYKLTFSGAQIESYERDIDLYDPDDEPPLTQAQAALPSAASRFGFLADGDGAQGRTVENKLRETVSVSDFPTIAEAVSANPGRCVVVPDSAAVVEPPADFSDVLFEYATPRLMRFSHISETAGPAKKTFKAQFKSAHPDICHSAVHIEAQAKGSGKNGPISADVGMTIAVHKQGYAGATSPTAGEIDGLAIFVRQDGPKGNASGTASTSDASGILVNVQNIEDVGFTSAWESSSSNWNRTSGGVVRSIQTQIGILDMNAVGSPSYGFVGVSTVGANGDAYYAGQSGSGTWDNILRAPNAVRIDNKGNYYAPTTEWAQGSWTIVRSAGTNGSTQFSHRGTGALFFHAPEGVIQFGTNNAIHWEFVSTGALRPLNTNTVAGIGDVDRRVNLVTKQINLGTSSTNGVLIQSGTGSPEGVLTARQGSLYLRMDGGAGTSMYVKESGTGNTGWTAK